MYFLRKLNFACLRSPDSKSEPSLYEKTCTFDRRLRRLFCPNPNAELKDLPRLPMSLICAIVDKLPFFEQLRFRRVSQELRNYLEAKCRRYTRMRVIRHDINEAKNSNRGWEVHRQNNVAVRFENEVVEIIVDEEWTVPRILVAASVMKVFREWTEAIELDAPMAEAMIVTLSRLDIRSWYHRYELQQATHFRDGTNSRFMVFLEPTNNNDENAINRNVDF